MKNVLAEQKDYRGVGGRQSQSTMQQACKKARDKFPITITPVEDAVIPMVVIEEHDEASPLGGPMRITWRIED